MKLKQFEQHDAYIFSLTFANGEKWDVDLAPLIAEHVGVTALSSARIDPEWGCLAFNNGAADIEPKTLYRWAQLHHLCHH